MTNQETFELALEVLKSATPKYTRQRKDQKTLGGALDYWKLEQHQRLKAIKALEEALAKQEQDEKRKLLPRCFADYQPNHTHDRKCEWCAVNTECQTGEQPKQEQGEPVAEIVDHGGYAHVDWKAGLKHPVGTKFYTTPQQRTLPQAERAAWVGLTYEERGQLWDEWENGHVVEATEAKLKEKNT